MAKKLSFRKEEGLEPGTPWSGSALGSCKSSETYTGPRECETNFRRVGVATRGRVKINFL